MKQLRRGATRAAQFASQELIPWEVEAELNEGKVPPEVKARHRKLAIELGFSAMDVPAAHGGRDARVHRPGRGLGAAWQSYQCALLVLLRAASLDVRGLQPEQLDRYVLPLMSGKRKECYAITESGSGSDVEIQTTHSAVPAGIAIRGEKWYVTSANHADYFILRRASPTDRTQDRTRSSSSTRISRESSWCARRPSVTPSAITIRSTASDVVVPENQRLGAEGAGMQHAHSWFRRERLMIAARCCGAASRLIEEASAFAGTRMIDGEPLAERQMIQAMLADSVTELWAARLITYEAAQAHDRGEELRSLHARCAIAKLYASEAANRIVDRALQIFGGRGYMRENCVERFFRELRVDRIWEGASEIQRLIIARALQKRGLEGM